VSLLLAVLSAFTACIPGSNSTAGTAAATGVVGVVGVIGVLVDDCGGGIERRAAGVALGPDVVATVAHTFARGASVHLLDGAGQDQPAELVWIDTGRDIALLRPARPATAWLDLGDAADGDQLQVLTGRRPASTAGAMAPETGPVVKPARLVRHVTATLDGAGSRAALEIEADIEAGDSGSPLIDAQGRVIGLVFAASRQAAKPILAPDGGAEPVGTADDHRAWAVAASEVADALTQPIDGPVPMAC
jgi:S1-C subfamily serine protease